MLQPDDGKLRLMNVNDLEMVLEWRNSDRIRANMYNDHVISFDEHNAWFKRQKSGESSRYLVFELMGRPVGLVYFVDIDHKNSKAFWGFYLGYEDLPSGSGTLLGKLGVDYAFNCLGIKKLCGEAFAFNKSSIRFHKKLGFVEEGRLVRHVLKNGEFEDIVSFALFKEDWQKQKITKCCLE